MLATIVGSLAVPLRADEADDQYAIAAGHYAQKRWELAVESFEAFLKQSPEHPKSGSALFYLGEAQLQIGQIEKAAGRFEVYLKKDPEGRHARVAQFRAGEAAYLADSHQRAKSLLEEFLSRYPDDKLNAYASGYLGEMMLAEQDLAGAESSFRGVLARFPDAGNQDQCRFGLGRALRKQGKSEEAERLFMAVAAKTGSPLADDAQFQLGALQYAMGKFENATATFDAFESTFKDSPWVPTARLARGWAAVKLDRLDEAKKFFQLIKGDPEVGIEAQYWLGLVEKTQEDWQGAAKTLLGAAEVDPAHKLVPAIRVHAGHALLHAGDAAAAAEQFDLAMAFPGEGNEWIDDAMRGKVQSALAAKDHAGVDRDAADFAGRFSDSPLKADVDCILAQSLIERKQFARAVEILEPMVTDQSDDEDLMERRYLLALAYEGLQRGEDALEMLEPVLSTGGNEFQADARLTQASLLIAMKRYAEAIGPLEAFLGGEPDGDPAVKAIGQLAISYARTGKLDQAKRAYARLLKEQPKHQLIVPITEQMAEAAYDAGELSWSRTLFRWLARSSGSVEYERKGLAGLAWSHFKLGELEEGAATFDELLKKDPDPALASEAALARGQILQKLERPQEALAMFDSVIDKYKDSEQHPEALLAAARLRDDLGQDAEAAVLYQRLTQEYPESAGLDSVLYHWAWALEDLGRTDEAVVVFRRIHEGSPEGEYWADATFRLADHAYRAGDYLAGRNLVTAILGAKTDDRIRQNTQFLLGQIASAEQKWPEARQAFQTLIDEYPESQLRLRAEYGVAEATFRQNDHQAAITLFQRLVDQTSQGNEPWFALFHVRLAQSLAQLKKWSEAYEIASKIEARFPGFEEQYEADYVIGRCQAAQADMEAARASYRKAYTSPNGDKTETAAKARFMIAESYFHQKNYEDALREYLALEILYAYPVWQAVALLQAGKCYEQLGEWDEAVKQYARVLEVYGDTDHAEEAKQRLPLAKQKAEMRLAG
jgi:TolA-binding protein